MSFDSNAFIAKLLQGSQSFEIQPLGLQFGQTELYIDFQSLSEVQPSTIRLICKGVKECRLEPRLDKPALSLSASTSHPILEDFGPQWAIYGQAPLPDPYRFFLEFSRIVEQAYGRMRDVRDYLNWGAGQQDWLQFVYSRSYHLLEGPQSLVEKCQAVLDAQAAPYMVLPPKGEQAPNSPRLVLLMMGESYVIAETLAAE